MRFTILSIAIIPLVFLSACVSTGTYEMAVSERDIAQQSLTDAREEIARNLEEKEKAAQELEAARLEAASTQARLVRSQTQIATLKNIEAETTRRNEIYGQFIERLKSMIDGGQLTVTIDQGRIVINLPNNVLFKSGRSFLNAKGKESLAPIAAVLSQFSDRRFQVEGHTDNEPIQSKRFPSNWELSTSRALSVVHLLIEMGVKPENISAAGFGEFRPRADNETKEGRELNRRIEIVMLPNLEILSDELPKVAE
ncbi:MAG: OmpA family protein [bacterium]|nr:OmpA family protein [bacterium]